MTPNKALQTDKDKLSCLLHSQKPRQLAFAAELGRKDFHIRQAASFLSVATPPATSSQQQQV